MDGEALQKIVVDIAGKHGKKFPDPSLFWAVGFIGEYVSCASEGDPGCDAYMDGMNAGREAWKALREARAQ